MARVLVVEDSPSQAQFVLFLLRDRGHEVEVVGDGVEALAAVRATPPDVVLTDMQMPRMNGLQLVHALRAEFPGLPVVLNTEYGSEELAVEALQAGATYYVPKRNLTREVGPLLDEVLSVSATQRKLSLFPDWMTAVEYRFRLENDPGLIPQAVGHVETLLQQLHLFDPTIRVRLGVAVHEAVVNAMIHGNLEVGSGAKVGDWEMYHALIARRRNQEPYRSRRVAVTVTATRAPSLAVRVADEGPGFDPATVPDPTSPANLGESSGRGLLLIRTFFDRVMHSPTGNEIVMQMGQPDGGESGAAATG